MSDAQLKPGDLLGKLIIGCNPKNDLVKLLQPIVNECIKNYNNPITELDGNGNFS